ncbi:hypothetical protein [Marinospirillum alkaliphilum]|uniref:Uncharacterized protein n=1 Tax=Marinospirillum alkaliphilum DSM 21637 TaxID=1122209 RepID=A0A1K1ZNT0_9GAMM|nr:hypothetical protein [Marinospirillum alkaliphilum]SFX75751.1 hypothetical protein SAMN02745752_02785 [Marinospirillum alkaliphilum DSM 21637]
MRIENAYTKSLEVQESLNTSLNSAQGAQFSLVLSLMMAPVYSPDLPSLYNNLPIQHYAPNPIYPTHIPTVYDPPGLSNYINRPPAHHNIVLVEDTYARRLARDIQSGMGEALVQGNAGYFSWLRALTEEYPKLQFVTTLKPASAPAPRQVAAAYAAQARPDTETLIQEINNIRVAA